MARALVTGGTGFIGRHLVKRLNERGDQVRCLVRNPRDDFAPLAVEYTQGDISQSESLDDAVRDIEVVYHLAAVTVPVRFSLYRLVNTEGTQRLAESCARQSRPPNFVYVSSLAAAGPAQLGVPLSEDCVPSPVSEYGRSKLAAEQCLRALADRLPVTVVRPPAVFGPGDRYGLKLFKVSRWGFGLVPGPTDFRLSYIHVADLVEALLLAGDRGQRLPARDSDPVDRGLYFTAGDEQPTVNELSEVIAQAQGLHVKWTWHVPRFLLRFAAAVNAVRTRLLGHGYFLNTDKLCEILVGPWLCSSEKAKSELGFLCKTSLDEGFRVARQWYCDQGWLSSSSKGS